MTYSLPLSRTLAWFRNLWGKPETMESEQSGSFQTSRQGANISANIKLTRYLPVQAYRAGSSKPLQFIATELGPQSLIFKTSSPIVDGEMFSVDVLLTGVGMVKGQAKLAWTLQSNQGFTGELTLWFKGEAMAKYLDFMRRQRAGCR